MDIFSRGVTLEQTYFTENGLPQRTQFLSPKFFINCDLSRVFGDESGCGGLHVEWCGFLSKCTILANGECHWTWSALMDKSSFTLNFQILSCESSLWG